MMYGVLMILLVNLMVLLLDLVVKVEVEIIVRVDRVKIIFFIKNFIYDGR